MDTMLKRLLSLAIALVMVIGLMPWNAASVYATEEIPEETETPAAGHVHTCEVHENCTAEWKPWDGISKDYAYGAIVSHNGQLWESVYNGQNVWEPGSGDSLWIKHNS